MTNILKDAIKITNDSIILATPLILFMWLLGTYIAITKSAVNTLPLIILSFVTTVFMVAAFSAGWFYMVKKSIQLSKQFFVIDADRAKATFNILKKMPSGIGKYFLSFLGMLLFAFTIVSILGFLVFKLGMLLIGNLNLDPNQLKTVMSSTADMKAFLDSLSFEQLIKLNNWNLLFLGTTSIITFLFMLWIPEIIWQTKNPFLALFRSIKKIFKRFWKSLKLYIFISVLNFIVSFISTFALTNPIFYFIMLVVYFYFLVYIVVLLFTYYDKEFEQ